MLARLIKTIPLLLAAALSVPQPATAAQGSMTLDRIRERGAINMGYIAEAVPFSFVGADGQPQGYSVDMCREIASAIRGQLGLAKLDTRWVRLTVQDRLEAVRSGKVDIECSTTTWTLSRNATVDFSLITFVDGGSIIAKSSSKYGRLQDFDGRRVGVIAGTTTEKVLRAAFAQRRIKLDVVPVASRVEGLNLLNEGKLDGFAADRTTLIGVAMTTPTTGTYLLIEEDFSVEPYAFAIPRGDADFRLAVNRALARLYRNNDIVRIYNQWLGGLGPPSLLLSAAFFVQALDE